MCDVSESEFMYESGQSIGDRRASHNNVSTCFWVVFSFFCFFFLLFFRSILLLLFIIYEHGSTCLDTRAWINQARASSMSNTTLRRFMERFAAAATDESSFIGDEAFHNAPQFSDSSEGCGSGIIMLNLKFVFINIFEWRTVYWWFWSNRRLFFD